MKPIVLMLLALTLALLLAACGEGNNNQTGSLPVTVTDGEASSTVASGAQPSQEDSDGGIYFELRKREGGLHSLFIYTNALPYSESLFTEMIITLTGDDKTAIMDFADTTTDRGMVVPEGLYAPIVQYKDKSRGTETSFYVKAGEKDGLIEMELQLEGDETFANLDWSGFKSCEIQLIKESQAYSNLRPKVLRETPLPKAPPIQRCLPDSVYDKKNMMARPNDALYLTPQTTDWAIFIDTYNEFTQDVVLTSFNAKGEIVKVMVREIRDWSLAQNMDEFIRSRNGTLVEDALYYEADPAPYGDDWSGKYQVFYRLVKNTGLQAGTGTVTYEYTSLPTQDLTGLDDTYMAQRGDFGILAGATPQTEDYVLIRNADLHTEGPATTTGLKDAPNLHEGFSYYSEYLTAYDQDGYAVQWVYANVCLDSASATQLARNYSYRLAENQTSFTSYKQYGNVFILEYGKAPKADLEHKTELYSPMDDGRKIYISKPYLTNRQIEEALKLAAETEN